MIAKWLREDYTDEQLLRVKGQPKTCRFKGHGVLGSILCTHSDFFGLRCIEDWCLSFIVRSYHKNYKPIDPKIVYAEEQGMKAAKKGNWPRVVFWAKRWLKLRGN